MKKDLKTGKSNLKKAVLEMEPTQNAHWFKSKLLEIFDLEESPELQY